MKYDIYDIKQDDLEGFSALIPDDLLSGNFHYIGAIDDEGYALGVLVWHLNLGYIQMDHIAVFPDYYGSGIGKDLLDYLTDKLYSISEFATIIAVYTNSSQYEAFDEFINKNESFTVVESGRFHIIDKKTRDNAVYYQKLKEKNFQTESFKSISPITKKRFYQSIEKKGINLFGKSDEKNLIPEISKCTVKDNKIAAVVLVSLNNLSELEVSFVYCDKDHSKDLGICLTEAIKAADNLYPDKNIVFNAENEQSINLSHKLFGDDLVDETVLTAVSFGKIDELVYG